MDTLERIVRDNAKQRFTMRPEPTGLNGEDELWIRANQGHSVAVSSPPGPAGFIARSQRLTALSSAGRVARVDTGNQGRGRARNGARHHGCHLAHNRYVGGESDRIHSLRRAARQAAVADRTRATLVLSRAAKEGLKAMGRNHIHCAVGLFGEEGVQSGTLPLARVG